MAEATKNPAYVESVGLYANCAKDIRVLKLATRLSST